MKPKKPGCGEAGAEPRVMARVAIPGSSPGPIRLQPQSRNKVLRGTVTAQTQLGLGLKVNWKGDCNLFAAPRQDLTKWGEAGPWASCRG